MTKIIIGIIIAVVIIGIALASPLFYDVEVDEPLPVALNNIKDGLTYEKFTAMDDENRKEIIEKMSDDLKERIMKKASTVIVSVSESINEMSQSTEPTIEILKRGTFEGLAGHKAEGLAKIVQVNDMTFLRFENFQVTNGPDLRVYITYDGDVKNGIHLEKLKGSKGDQNYLLDNVDVGFYDEVIIYCQPFGVYFGQAKLVIVQ